MIELIVQVHFILNGDDDETNIRTFADPHRRIFETGGIDGFIMAVPKCLGRLNHLFLWHDNSGKDSSASWFLKYILVEDLQTDVRSYFLCQQWLAVEEEDGTVRSRDFELYEFLDWNRVDRTFVARGQSGREECVQLRCIETSLSQYFRWTSLVFDLLSSIIESFHSSTTLYLLFYFAVYSDAV